MSELKGIDWYNIRTDETIYTKRPAQIKAVLNLSDLGVNRQSDKGWRLGKEWYHRLQDARNDFELMNTLIERYGEEVTDAQILIYLFNQELRAEQAANRRQHTAPYEDKYRRSLASEPELVDNEEDVKTPRTTKKEKTNGTSKA